jgi:hypothetical protein
MNKKEMLLFYFLFFLNWVGGNFLIYGPFGSRNRPLEWNSYSYEITILLFGKGLFLRIMIHMGIINPLHTGIVIL